MAYYNNQDPNQGYNQPYRQDGYQSTAVAGNAAAAMKLVYMKMCFALIVTGLVSFFCANSTAYMSYLFAHSWVMWVLIIAQFGLVFAINGAINKMSTGMGTLLFYVYAVLMGLWLSPLFLIYTHASIAKTFFITAGTFGAMSIYGYTTNQDLTKFGQIMFMALIGLVIACVVNIFMHSSTLDWIISIAGIFIFVGLTAWDTQTIKRLGEMMPANEHGRLATLGALSLYLDFINIFIFLLRIFGASRD